MIITKYSHLSDSELIREVESSDDHLTNELSSRLEAIQAEDSPSAVQEKEESMTRWAVSCFKGHAGEDHHINVIENLQRALKENKPEMILEIKEAISMLSEMDSMAGNEIASMISGDSF